MSLSRYPFRARLGPPRWGAPINDVSVFGIGPRIGVGVPFIVVLHHPKSKKHLLEGWVFPKIPGTEVKEQNDPIAVLLHPKAERDLLKGWVFPKKDTYEHDPSHLEPISRHFARLRSAAPARLSNFKAPRSIVTSDPLRPFPLQGRRLPKTNRLTPRTDN